MQRVNHRKSVTYIFKHILCQPLKVGGLMSNYNVLVHCGFVGILKQIMRESSLGIKELFLRKWEEASHHV